MSKERYELKIYAGCESYSIADAKEKHQLSVKNAVNLLNKYDQQLAELKVENEKLLGHKEIIDKTNQLFADKCKKYEQQLKDNIKQVCEKIRKELEKIVEVGDYFDTETDKETNLLKQIDIEKILDQINQGEDK